MASQQVYLNEGPSENRPPLFEGKNFSYWKHRMQLFLMSHDPLMWEIVETGDYQPTKVNDGGASVRKHVTEMTSEERSRYMLNAKAKMYLTCALGKSQFDKVASCETAKQIWDTLQIVYEGTRKVKVARSAILLNQFQNFKMLNGESIESMFSRMIVITNELETLGHPIGKMQKAQMLLGCLPFEWHAKVSAIEEAKEIDTIELEELQGILMVHEQKLQRMKLSRKDIALALKAFEQSEQSSSDSDSESDLDDEEELAFITRQVKRMWKNKKGMRKWKPGRKLESKKEKTTTSNIICYGCQKPGHLKQDCPDLKKLSKRKPEKGKRKAMMATWDDSDSDNDAELEQANLCMMARSDSEPSVSKYCSQSDYCSDSDGSESEDELSYSELKDAFNSLLRDSHTLVSKISVFKKQIKAQKQEISELSEQNIKLTAEVKSLKESKSEDPPSKSEDLEIIQEQKITIHKLSEENKKLLEEKSVLQENVSKFMCSTSKLDQILDCQKNLNDKTGLGFNNNIKNVAKAVQNQNLLKPKAVQNEVFVRPKTVQKQKTAQKQKPLKQKCSVCHKFGHNSKMCWKSKKTILKVTNPQGPIRIWVPKSILNVNADGSCPFRRKLNGLRMVPRFWVLKAHDWTDQPVPVPHPC